jgi:uncharacterized membrane protein YbaN (DUF454 family)
MFRIILIFFGSLSLCLGITGIFIPGLPTTPFLLLTAGMYIRSSERLYNYIIENRFIGDYIKEFRSKGGMTRRLKIFSISLMWIMISISSLLFIQVILLKLALAIAGLTGTIIMGFVVPTLNK